jgi:hypothetical protein
MEIDVYLNAQHKDPGLSERRIPERGCKSNTQPENLMVT